MKVREPDREIFTCVSVLITASNIRPEDLRALFRRFRAYDYIATRFHCALDGRTTPFPIWTSHKRFTSQSLSAKWKEGNEKGIPFLWTESKSSKAWNRVFAERYPKCAKDGSWAGLTQEQIMRINDYLYRWAKDSTDPGNGC